MSYDNKIFRLDERKFLQFIKEDLYFSRYYNVMLILFETGLRIMNITV